MERSLLDTLFQYVEFLDDYADQEIDLHVIVREQETIVTRFEEDLSDEQKEDLVSTLTTLAEEMDERGQELVTEILEGMDLLDEYEEED